MKKAKPPSLTEPKKVRDPLNKEGDMPFFIDLRMTNLACGNFVASGVHLYHQYVGSPAAKSVPFPDPGLLRAHSQGAHL